MNELTDGMIYLLMSTTLVCGVLTGIAIGVRFGAYLMEKFIDTRAFVYICDKIEKVVR